MTYKIGNCDVFKSTADDIATVVDPKTREVLLQATLRTAIDWARRQTRRGTRE